MDPKELRGLLEAYSEVYAPEEEIDEEQKPFPFKKVEKQMEKARKGSVYAKKGNPGPVPNTTDDEKKNTTRFSKMFHAQQKAKRAKQEADKARRSPTFYKDTHPASAPKMAKAQREEFEIDEAVKGESSERRKDLAAERRAGHRPKSAKEGENYASHKLAQMAYVKRQRMGEEVEQIDEISAGLAGKVVNARIERTGAAADRENRARTPQNVRDTVAAADKEAKARKLAAGVRARRAANEEVEIFDVVLEFLQAEGYAETLEEAEWLMANVIDEEAIDIILGEADSLAAQQERREKRQKANMKKQGTPGFDYSKPPSGKKGYLDAITKKEEYVDESQHARENPEKYEREQSKKSAPVRGEKTPMPPRGDKRREDFEKWYAANVR
jgi:hypothetical protein